MTDSPRSVRRAEITANRREILVQFHDKAFTLKNARDFLRHNVDNPLVLLPENRKTVPFLFAVGVLDWFLFKKYFARSKYDRVRYTPEFTRFADQCLTVLKEKGFIEPQPEPDHHTVEGSRRDTERYDRYRLTPDGVLLMTASWFPPLPRAKADRMIPEFLERVIRATALRQDFLHEVSKAAVFGSYLDDRLSSFNDLDILIKTRWLPELTSDQYMRRSRTMFRSDGRTVRRLGDIDSWPEEKLEMFLHSRKRQLRITNTVRTGEPFQVKVIYELPEGVLKEPYILALPEMGTSSEAW